jgi:hypothetical protein
VKQFLFILFLLAFYVPLFADAHQIKTDHGITVLLHVDPSDEPFSGTTTRMYLVFTNKDQIDPDQCDCIAYIAPYSKLDNIKEEGTHFNFSTQTERVMGSYSISHVFPRHDVYAVVLEGSPKEGASFEPFRIVYDLRVARGEEVASASAPIKSSWQNFIITHRYILAGSLALLLLVIIGGYSLYSHRRHRGVKS